MNVKKPSTTSIPKISAKGKREKEYVIHRIAEVVRKSRQTVTQII